MSTAALAWPDPATVEVDTDGKTGNRFYRFGPDKPWLVSATTVLKVIAKGWQYDNWVAEQERAKWTAKLAEVCTEHLAPEFMLSEVQKRVGKPYVYATARDGAAADGSAVHEAVQAYLEAELKMAAPPIPQLTPDQMVGFSEFLTWWGEAGLELVASEQPVFDPMWGWAGRFDHAVRERKTGRLGLLDLKNTKWLNDTAHVQLGGAYMRAVQQWGDYEFAKLVKLPKGGRGMEVKAVGEDMFCGNRTRQELEDTFKAALDLWRGLNRGKE